MTVKTNEPADTATVSTGVARVPVRLGLAPTSIEDGWRLAQMMAKSSIVPKNFQQKPEDILVAIQLGAEIGLAPMQALQSIAVINGRPSVWGDGFLGLIVSSPVYQNHDEYFEVHDGGKMVRRDGLVEADFAKDTTAAVCTFWRVGKPDPVTQRFTVAMAKKAGLLGSGKDGGKEGPWRTYPDRMLRMRARSWAGRDCFADLLRGIRTAEEAMDEPPPPTTMPEPRAVHRLSDAVPATDDDIIDPTTGEVLPDPPTSAPITAAEIFGR